MTEEQERHLMKHAEKDEIYQDMLYLRGIYEHDFKRILLSLSKEDQHCVRMYVNVCVAVESRISRTAYFLEPQT